MSKLTLIGIVAIVILLVGASVVFAQSTPGNGGFGGRMMQAPTPTTPGPMMGNGDWEQMKQRHEAMGQYVPEEMRGMHEAMGEAMQSGDMQKMHETCQSYWNNQGEGTENPETPQNAPTSARRGMMGGRSF